jgi:hypothetical protein
VDFTIAVDLRGIWEDSHGKTGGLNMENCGFSIENDGFNHGK